MDKLENEKATGKIGEELFESLHAAYKKRAIEVMKQIDGMS